MSEHTGGGDGDADRIPIVKDSCKDNSPALTDGDEEGKNGETEGGKKRKRGKTMMAGIKFSRELLERFMKSEIYKMIDNV